MLLGDFANGGFLAGGGSDLPDPIIPGDGTQNFTGDISVSGDWYMASGGQFHLADGLVGTPSLLWDETAGTVFGLYYAAATGLSVVADDAIRLAIIGATIDCYSDFLPNGTRDLGASASADRWAEVHATDYYSYNQYRVAAGGSYQYGDSTARTGVSGNDFTVYTGNTLRATIGATGWTLPAGSDIIFDDGVEMQAIGEMYQAYNAAPSTENFGTSYSKMTGFDTDGVSLGTTVDSTTNNRITVTNAGRYYIDVFMSVDDNTGAGATWDFAVYYGDSGSPAASTTLQIRRTIGSDGVINFGGILDLTAGQVVELWIKNGTGTRALEIHSAKLGVYAWGETP